MGTRAYSRAMEGATGMSSRACDRKRVYLGIQASRSWHSFQRHAHILHVIFRTTVQHDHNVHQYPPPSIRRKAQASEPLLK